jgi:serine/threonine-protein kinase HipA
MTQCMSTLADLPEEGFSSRALRRLSDGRKLSPRLSISRADIPRIRAENASRMSISGVQDKLSLRLYRGQLRVADTDGEYILKPIPGTRLPELHDDLPANEHLTMQLAEQVFGIRTAANGLVRLADGELAYLTRRFDRTRQGKRIPQEDFCQLMERTSPSHGKNYKYDSSYEELGQTLRRFCAAYLVEVEELMRRLVFCYAIGNGDAHLKNFSVQRQSTGDYLLSPAYDLVASSIHLPNESRLALDLLAGDELPSGVLTNGYETGSDFGTLAGRLGMRPRRFAVLLTRVQESREPVLELIERSFLTDGARESYKALFEDRLKALSQ